VSAGLGRDHQGTKQPVRKGEDHIEISVVALVVDAVVDIQPLEDGGPFDPTVPGDMHDKVEILVEEIVEDHRGHPAPENLKPRKGLGTKDERGMNGKEGRCVPPGKGHDFLILFPVEVVASVKAEDRMVD
jgi:hypothetical protein